MQRVIEIFYELSKIPRCSTQHKLFIDYIKEFAIECDYLCEIDQANNILCYKKSLHSSLCLQSHYDMVCLNDDSLPDIIQNSGFLQAQNSTLGADNGIGCALMLYMMECSFGGELLFTSDEEIGLIGANNIGFELACEVMLNLDSEALSEVCIGCAGGVDITAWHYDRSLVSNNSGLELYEISVEGLDGGHSGIDIEKNIPNALKLLAHTLYENEVNLLDINGGERINSIAKQCKAIVASHKAPLATHPNISIQKISSKTFHYTLLPFEIVQFLFTFAHGVRGLNTTLGVVQSSINLATIKTHINSVEIELSARSMEDKELEILTQESVALLESFGFTCHTSGKYPAWTPDINPFTQKVLDIYRAHIPNTQAKAIHAGLECAIFKKKYPNIDIASIGPNIYFPHSFKEKCDIESVEIITQIVKDICDEYSTHCI